MRMLSYITFLKPHLWCQSNLLTSKNLALQIIEQAMKLLNSIHFAPYFRDYLISSSPKVCRGCFFHLSFPPKKLLKKGSSVVLLTTSILKVTSKDMSCFEIGFTTQVLCLTPLHGKSNSLRSDAANHQIQICYGKKFTLNGAFSQFYELFCAKRWRYVPFFPRLLS